MGKSDTDNSQDDFASLLSGSSTVFLGNVFSKLFYFLAFVVVIRSLEIGSYGQLALALSVFQIGTTLSLFGFNNSLQHFLPKSSSGGEKRRIAQLALGTTSVLALSVAVITLISADGIATLAFDAPESADVIKVIAITIPAAVMFRTSMSVLRSLEVVRPHVYLENALQPLTRFVFVLFVGFIGAGAIGMATAYLGMYMIVLLLALWVLYRELRKLPRAASKGVPLRKLFTFSAPLLGVGVINMLAGQVDTFLLGILSDTRDVGFFRAIFTLSQNFLIIVSSLQFLFTPMFSRLVGEGRSNLQDFYERATRWAFYGTICILMFVFVFAEPLLSSLFRPDYIIVADELRLLTLSSGVAAFLGFNSQALMGFGNSRIQLIGSVVLVIVNSILDIALIPALGVSGAVVGTIVATVLTQVVFSAKLYLDHRVHAITKRTAVPAGYAVIAAVCLMAFGVSSMHLLARVGTFLFVFSILLLVVATVGGIEKRDIEVGYSGLRLIVRRLRPNRPQ